MRYQTLALALVVIVAAFGIAVAGIGPEFLIRVDLNHRTDFDRAMALKLEPVYRCGNNFYCVAGARVFDSLDKAKLKYMVVDRDPFTTAYYYVDTRPQFVMGPGLEKQRTQTLDEIGGATLNKRDLPVSLEERVGEKGLIPITGERIPLVYMSPLTVARATLDEPLLDTIAAGIKTDSVRTHASRLVDFKTRYVYADSNVAAQAYLKQKFLSFGYTDVKEDTFDVESTPGIGHNIICTKVGTIEPDKVIVVGAHFDDFSADPLVSAPGADDNASGTAGVLEIARVLAQIPTRKTIVFIAFNAEEQWLVGSFYYAQRAAAAGTDIELMLNMDMIGHDPDSSWNLLVHTDSTSIGYAELADQLARSRTRLLPTILPYPAASDHLPFYYQGYHIVYAQESKFNHDGYHNETDQIYRLNLPYWVDAIRTVGMTAYAVAVSPAPVAMVGLLDVGDGQSLEVHWQPSTAPDISGYRIYWGPSSGSYPNALTVPASDPPSARLTGLPEDQPCYVIVTAVGTAGRESAVHHEIRQTPQRAPHAPQSPFANVEYRRIELTWAPSVDLDFDHYIVLRGTDSTVLTILAPSVTGEAWTDSLVSGHTRYYYRITASDHDGNVGTASDLVSGIPATFDRDILLLDMTASTPGNPSEAQQWNAYNAIFAKYDHWYYRYDEYSVPVDRSELGQYKVVFWLDDDVEWESWPADHVATMNWYPSHGTGLVLVGWQTAGEAIGAGVLYDVFGTDVWGSVPDVDCLGGLGDIGFPSVAFDTSRIRPDWNGKLPNIALLRLPAPSAEPFMRYNSAVDDPWREEHSAAVRYNSGAYKTITSTLPLYYLRVRDGAKLVKGMADRFGCSPNPMGDLTGDKVVNVLDVMAMIRIVFGGTLPPAGYDRVDFNAGLHCQRDGRLVPDRLHVQERTCARAGMREIAAILTDRPQREVCQLLLGEQHGEYDHRESPD